MQHVAVDRDGLPMARTNSYTAYGARREAEWQTGKSWKRLHARGCEIVQIVTVRKGAK